MNRPLLACFFFFIFSFASVHFCISQKQMVFLQKGNVIGRFTEGDYFEFQLKNRRWVEGYVAELSDFTLITAALDTIPFQMIEKFDLRKQINRSFTKTLGKALLAGGVGYIAIDQLNVLIDKNKAGFDAANRWALGIAAAGGALTFIKPRYKKLGRGVAVRSIDYRSPYYRLRR